MSERLEVRHDELSVLMAGVPVRVERMAPVMEGPRPTLVVLHGSDGFSVHGLFYRQMARQFARAGYVALLPHYYDRTGSQYVEDDAARHQMIAEHYDAWVGAVGEVIRHAATLPEVDAARMALFGVSLGAAVSLGVAARNPEVRCVVEYFGWLHPGVEAAALPPTLVLHGDADEVIPVRRGHQLIEALTAAGRPFEHQIYPGQGHGFTGEAGRDAFARALAFFGKHLG